MSDQRHASELPSVSIVVLNYNSLSHLHHNLPSLRQLVYPKDRLELLLVDNASTDDSTKWVAENYPSVRIMQNDSNLGFAAGNNEGVRGARGDWVAILNPDTRVPPDWLAELVRPVTEDPEIACVGSRVLSWDGKTIDFADAAINFMGWGCQPGFGSPQLHEFSQDKPLLFANGGAMLVKRSLFLEIGGFDPDYFAYFEDVDYGWRLSLMGYKVVLAANAIVYHRHHGTWDQVADAKKWLLAERNTLSTLIKNFDDDQLAYTLPAALLLLLQRAYLDVRPDPAAFPDFSTLPSPTGQYYDRRYYLKQLGQLIRQGDMGQLARRTADELRRRRARRRQRTSGPSAQPTQMPQSGRFQAPAVALSRIIAGREVQRTWLTLLAKRTQVQAARQLDDCSLFPLFKWTLVSNFEDNQFILAMNHVIGRFGLAARFEASDRPAPLPSHIHRLSLEVSELLLDLINQVFVLSQVKEAEFRIGAPGPEPVISIPMASIAVLVQANHLLWSMPDSSFPEILAWLKREIEKRL